MVVALYECEITLHTEVTGCVGKYISCRDCHIADDSTFKIMYHEY